MAMTDAHRLSLQSFMTKGVMSCEEVIRLHAHACAEFQVYHVENGHDEFVKRINRNIQPFSMEIRVAKDEDDGNQVYVLVRTEESEICKLISDYQANELALFQKIIDLIIENGTGMASSTDVLNVVLPQPHKLLKIDKQIVLDKLVAEKWLKENQGQISLTTRSILELKHYLREHFPDDVIVCNLCDNIVFKGNNCSNINCSVRLHFHCSRDMFHGRPNAVCPGCATKWPYVVENGMEVDSEQGTSSSSSSSSTSKKRKR
ncbi:non-structural maintenance of chromosomes element 1 homolog [Antedon mediterranea]|uniref:non-structural maintenance of chromosomes element 1 homolog n=1 Tax=Antedon mediterranea TaxID=105859 RepID=UPI003AF64BCA